MDEKCLSILKNKTWDICSLPAGRSAIRKKWLYKTKPDAETVFKAIRLVIIYLQSWN
jgi:hypothetical protein